MESKYLKYIKSVRKKYIIVSYRRLLRKDRSVYLDQKFKYLNGLEEQILREVAQIGRFYKIDNINVIYQYLDSILSKVKLAQAVKILCKNTILILIIVKFTPITQIRVNINYPIFFLLVILFWGIYIYSSNYHSSRMYFEMYDTYNTAPSAFASNKVRKDIFKKFSDDLPLSFFKNFEEVVSNIPTYADIDLAKTLYNDGFSGNFKTYKNILENL